MNDKYLGYIEVSLTRASNTRIKLVLAICSNLYRSGLDIVWHENELSKVSNKVKSSVEKCLDSIEDHCPEIIKSKYRSIEKNNFYIDNSNLTTKFTYEVNIETSEKISDSEIKKCLIQSFEDCYPVSISLKKSSLFEIADLYQVKYAKVT